MHNNIYVCRNAQNYLHFENEGVYSTFIPIYLACMSSMLIICSIIICLSAVSTNNPREPLDWPKRYQIILGICVGLQYLHAHCNNIIAHLDLKPNNILLDLEMMPKIADFGLSRTFVMAKTHKDTYTTSGTK